MCWSWSNTSTKAWIKGEGFPQIAPRSHTFNMDRLFSRLWINSLEQLLPGDYEVMHILCTPGGVAVLFHHRTAPAIIGHGNFPKDTREMINGLSDPRWQLDTSMIVTWSEGLPETGSFAGLLFKFDGCNTSKTKETTILWQSINIGTPSQNMSIKPSHVANSFFYNGPIPSCHWSLSLPSFTKGSLEAFPTKFQSMAVKSVARKALARNNASGLGFFSNAGSTPCCSVARGTWVSGVSIQPTIWSLWINNLWLWEDPIFQLFWV